MKKLIVWFVASMMLGQIPLGAQNSSRDADIDLKMNADALSAIAPPTGSQAISPVPSNGAQPFIDPYLPAAIQGGAVIMGQTDSRGRVYDVRGDVTRSSSESPLEKKLKKNDVIRQGDIIATGANSGVSITFDENYMNAVHIPENSKALIKNIEPTDIQLENGSLFNAVDGLPQGSTWKVATPAAVAAVRGTLYLVRFQASDGTFLSATVDVPNDGKDSAVDIRALMGNAAAVVPEGKQIILKQGQAPDESLVTDIDPNVLEQILAFFENLLKLRDENDLLIAPSTSGQITGLGVLDPAGPGVVGGNDSRNFDPFELGTIPDETTTTTGIETGLSEGPGNVDGGTGDGFGEGSGDGFDGVGDGIDDGGDGFDGVGDGIDGGGDGVPDGIGDGLGDGPGIIPCNGGGGHGHPNNPDPNPGRGCD